MIGILDYGAGNQTSVSRALTAVDVPWVISADPARIDACSGLIFPGVGAAGQAMGHLRSTGLDACLRGWVAAGRPLLGVCLGCQILLESSEENATQTLGILPGQTRRFQPGLVEENGEAVRIPHMGWNGVSLRKPSRLFAGVPEDAEFYFVHSYYVQPAPELVIGTTRYGLEFCSVYGRDGLWAAQFHIEKSGRPGLRMLRNFYDYCCEQKGEGAR